MASRICFSALLSIVMPDTSADDADAFWLDEPPPCEQAGRRAAHRARLSAVPISWFLIVRLNAVRRETDALLFASTLAAKRPEELVFEQIRVAQPFADCRVGPLGLAAGDRISAIIGGVEGAGPVVAGQADATERRVRRRAVGWLVPVDDPGANV